MDDLLARVRDTQDEALGDTSVRDAVEARVVAHARRHAPPMRRDRRPTLLAMVAIFALAIGGTVAWGWTRGPAPRASLSFEVAGGVTSVGGFVEALDASEVRFSDRSVVRARRGTSLRIVSTTPDGAQVAIERGEVRAAVVHDATTDWRFLAGPFAIVVTGTRFDASWSPSAAELVVAVREGSVRVEGACLHEPRSVRAGESVRMRCGWSEVPASPPASSPPLEAAEPSVPTRRATRAAHRGMPQPRLEREAPAEAPPPSEDSASDDSASEPAQTAAPSARAQIEAATRASLAGEVDDAVRMLREVREAYPGTSDASLAAFLLGRLAFDEQHDYADAARWFATYVSERPEGPLTREAMGRELEARVRGGDAEAARAVAERYLARFPQGPHAARARQLTREVSP